MTALADATIKVSALVLAALAATSLLRGRSAALRHAILGAAVAGATVMPLLAPLVPSWHVDVSILSRESDAGAGEHATESGRMLSLSTGDADRRADLARTGGGSLFLLVWLAGVACSLLALAAGLGRLAWLAARSERVLDGKWTVPAHDMAQAFGVFRPVVLLQTDHPTLLVTWGARWPKVILPRGAQEWTDDRIRVVLCHELAHIGRRDWMLQMTAELLRSAYWFNPLVWIACRRLRQESEHACDDAVLHAGITGADYASHLLDLARAAIAGRRDIFPQSTALAIARPSSLERRVRAMLKSGRNRVPLSRAAVLAVAVVWLGAASAVAGFGTTARVLALTPTVPPARIVPLNILDRSNGGTRGRSTVGGPSVGVVPGGQVAFATLGGTLTDQLGGLLPGVTVSLMNREAQTRHEVRSGRDGGFEFVGVPAGTYVFEAALPGFKTFTGNMTVASGDNMHTSIRLEVGSLTETIRITGNRTTPTVVTGDTAPRVAGVGRGRVPACSAPLAGGIGGNIKQPTKIRDVKPIYPPSAQSSGLQGTVSLKAVIGTDGYVKDVEVLRSPDAELASAAVEAVRGWEFTATLLNCVPIDVNLAVTMTFSLGQ